MDEGRKQRDASGTLWPTWRYAAIAVILIAILSIWPQVDLKLQRGEDYQGAYASTQFDDSIYITYLNGVVLGRPYRSDPLVEIQPGQNPPASLFSVQIIPPWILSSIARALGLDARQMAILFPLLIATLASGALFYILLALVRDPRLALLGVLFILCMGTTAGRDGFVIHLLGLKSDVSGLPFLRRFQPGFAFPLFFLFVYLVWKTLAGNARASRVASIAAGCTFAFIVFTYFFLWTAAAAWAVSFAGLWAILYREEWKNLIKRVWPMAGICIAALALYAMKLREIATTAASTQALEMTHHPNLLRGPLAIALVVIFFAWLAVRKGLVKWADPFLLLALSLALHLFVVFNQQVLTGRSLQSFHYEIFIGNYAALFAVVLMLSVFLRENGTGRLRMTQRFVFYACTLCFVWGELEVRFNNLHFRKHNIELDSVIPLANRMTQLAEGAGKGVHDREVVFTPDIFMVGDNLPSFAPQAILWATHGIFMSSLNSQQRQDRYFQHLYYSGMTPDELYRRLVEGYSSEHTALFGYERYFKNITINYNPPTESEVREKVELYRHFIRSFDYARAWNPRLSWVILSNDMNNNTENLDRWYVRENEEQVGRYRILRVRPRQAEELENTAIKDRAMNQGKGTIPAIWK
jgi:hypothetical protein